MMRTEAPPPHLSSLNLVMTYHCSDVVESFLRDFDISWEEAENIFDDTKRWLWLCNQQQRLHDDLAKANVSATDVPRTMSISSHLWIIDQMWHAFILDTAHYQAFCNAFFGRLVGHSPVRRREKFTRALPVINRRSSQELRIQVEFTIAQLGIETATRWYKHFPHRFRSSAKPKATFDPFRSTKESLDRRQLLASLGLPIN